MTRKLRFAGTYIALAAMLLRALLPAGWMPASTGSGGTPLVICTLNGLVQFVLGHDGQLHKSKPVKDDARHHEICPFAAALHMVAPANLAALAPQSLAPTTVERVGNFAVIADGSHHSPQSPRAPPTLA